MLQDPSLPTPDLSNPDYVAYSGLIIDDIVLPDGRTYFNTLGGSGTHALIGMRVWSDRLGYFAAVGSDFGRDHRQQLERLGSRPAWSDRARRLPHRPRLAAV